MGIYRKARSIISNLSLKKSQSSIKKRYVVSVFTSKIGRSVNPS